MLKVSSSCFLTAALVSLLTTACGGGTAQPSSSGPERSQPVAAASSSAGPSASQPASQGLPPSQSAAGQSSGGPQTAGLAALIAAAKAEGSVTYYTPVLEPALQEVFEVFKAKYGIPVTLLQLTNAPLVERFYADLQRGTPPDVIEQSDRTTFKTLISEGHIAPYESEAVKSDYPADRKPDAPNGVPYSNTGLVFVYNVNLVTADNAKKLIDWTTVFDPQLAGHFGMSDPNVVGGALTSEWSLRQHFGASDWSNVYLKKLAQLKPKMYSSSGPVATAVGSGEIAVGWTTDFVLSPLVEKGAPIAFSYSDPFPATFSEVGLVKEAKHPNAGKLFLEWVTGPEAGSLISQKTGQAPSNPKAVDGRPVTKQKWFAPPKNVLPPPNPPTNAERTAYLAEFNQIVLGK